MGVTGQDLDPDLEERQPHSAAEYLAALWLGRSWSWNIVSTTLDGASSSWDRKLA